MIHIAPRNPFHLIGISSTEIILKFAINPTTAKNISRVSKLFEKIAKDYFPLFVLQNGSLLKRKLSTIEILNKIAACSRFIERLDLSHLRGLTNDHLRTILEQCPRLTTLDLTNCDFVDGETFLILGEHHQLTQLTLGRLSRNEIVTLIENFPDQFQKINFLKQLTLKYLTLKPPFVNCLAGFSQLTTLTLHFCEFEQEDQLLYLGQLRSLHFLSLAGTGGYSLKTFQRFVQRLPHTLVTLDLSNGYRDEFHCHDDFSHLPRLTSLNLMGSKVTDTSLKQYPLWIKEIDLKNCFYISRNVYQSLICYRLLQKLVMKNNVGLTGDEKEISQLGQLTHLTYLSIKVHRQCLSFIVHLKELRHLSLYSGITPANERNYYRQILEYDLEDSDLKMIATCRKLRVFKLTTRNKFTGTGFKHFQKLPLEKVLVESLTLSKTGIEVIARLPKIRHLCLAGGYQLRKKDLRPILEAEQLTFLELRGFADFVVEDEIGLKKSNQDRIVKIPYRRYPFEDEAKKACVIL